MVDGEDTAAVSESAALLRCHRRPTAMSHRHLPRHTFVLSSVHCCKLSSAMPIRRSLPTNHQ